MANDTVMIYEILEAIGKQPSIKKKIQILKNMDCPALRHILKGAFDPNVKWLLPPGTPPNFKPDDAPAGLQFQSIHQQTPKFYLFVQAGVDSGKCPDLKQAKREQIFVQMLESLHAKEAQLLIDMKDQNVRYNGLTPKLINEAFPGLISETGKWQ